MYKDIISISVYDCFNGKIKILKKKSRKYLIEIVDVCMCYPQQKQLRPGERMWINKDEIVKKSFVDQLRAFWLRCTQNSRFNKNPF